ncbi:alpha/beta hydrolase [Corynebacterium sp. CCM 8835]|uniref:Alpha/beta hydrolase n=1 Tax=Corynebacterium antarcticum TaxID=2800405 RepID=A0ABS1FP06_9CORY|nr:alpha/beta hydrolase [Corynebacterium antarcticum]MCK7641882.1 alpha/beta hydrolase [Corynebacterium antarcticum]MCK7660011.1 alpha/beta hydrolase [Corynebacterium antarcticum]MCL0245111.1 alpha/beta hydrolase [Corynebacterium antarcticum]MCX7491546.1 alpha/beta hydrolase [Corynebacterium antarcticum]MCX7539337.1 alpha/beta hydrolase [Corynebacterium antarcticum]
MVLDPGRAANALRRISHRITPWGRSGLRTVRAGIQTEGIRPGLTDIDRRGTVTNDGIDLHYYEVGPEHADTTVVFVHGFTLTAEAWFFQVDHLRHSHPDIRSVLLDLRGHGATGMVAPERCTIDGAADDVLAVIAARVPTGRIILVGHSMGGMILMSLVRRCGDTLRDRISAVITVSTAMEPMASGGIAQIIDNPVADRVHGVISRNPEESDRIRKELMEMLAPVLAVTIFQRNGTDYDVIEFHADQIHETPAETYIGFFPELQSHQELAAVAYLSEIPGYVVVGDKDNVTPVEQAERTVELWPRAKLRVIPDAGHMVVLEAPDAVNAIIDEAILATRPAVPHAN